MIDTPAPDEFAFIFDSWARSFRKSPWAGCVVNTLYDAVSRATSAAIVDRGARVLVAVTAIAGQEDAFPEVRRVMGYSVSEPDSRVLHYLYVKDDFRRMGIGRALLEQTCPEGEWSYSHRTRTSERFLNRKSRRFFWDPVTARVSN